ncbi:acyl-CoA N-acyltransferase [Trametes punicea]|nr:acyl-CoA N-acyltransferase [Trametes punicea]
MSVTIREVTELSEAEMDKYNKLLAEAFHYQLFGGALGNDRSLQEPMMRAHLAPALVNGSGEVHVAELPDVGAVGVAIWFRPGHTYLDSDAQRNAGWNELMDRLPTQYSDWWATFLKEYDELAEKTIGREVKRGGYHLQLIGVVPEYQRKGIGTALIRYAENKAHALKVPTTIETIGAFNVRIYQSLGYKVAGSGHLTSPPPADGTFEMFVFIKQPEATDFGN